MVERNVSRRSEIFVLSPRGALAAAVTVAAVAAATAVGEILVALTGKDNLGPACLLLLLVVVSASVLYGTPLGLFATVIAALALDYFFIPPKHSFAIADPLDTAAFFMFAIACIAVSQLAGRLKAREAEQRAQLAVSGYLLDVSRQLAAAMSVGEACRVVLRECQILYGIQNVVVMARGEDGGILEYPMPNALSHGDRESLRRRLETPLAATAEPQNWSLFPLTRGPAPMGYVVLSVEAQAEATEQETTLRGLVLQASLRVEQRLLEDALSRERAAVETERMRSTLLFAIAHDLRTPLAVIKGSAELLERQSYSEASVHVLADRIKEAADRSSKFISDVQAFVRADSEPADPQALSAYDVVAEVKRIRTLMAPPVIANPITLVCADDVAPCILVPALFEHIMVNLIENAAKASPPGAEVSLRITQAGAEVMVEVLDRGPGFPEAQLGRVFDRYARSSQSTGSGLGLTIARDFARRMRANVEARNRSDGPGAQILLRLTPDPCSGPKPSSL